MLSPTQNGAKLFPRLRARPGPTDRGPGWGGELGDGGGGEKSRRHRPMVQSSRGWDKAPHSGWGSNHLHLPRGKGQNPLPEPLLALCSAMAPAPLRPAFPARSLPPATPERLARSAGRAHLSSPARVGWAGTAVGRPARFCGGGWAGAWGAAGARGAAGGLSWRARGRRRGVGLGAGGLSGLGSLLCLGRPRHRLAIDCWLLVPYAQVGVPGPGEGWPVWGILGGQCSRWAGRRPRSTSALGRRGRVRRLEPQAFGKRVGGTELPAYRQLCLSTF